ncbi:MAG: BrnT family toxin [Desulfobulbaceae bacterium]
MQYEWNEGKRAANLAKHGVDFLEAERFEWSSAIEAKDDRFRYGEDRWIALGLIGKRLHVLIYTRRKAIIRIISLRRANKRESEYYEKTQA